MINENERQLEFTCRCGERFLLRFSVKPSERFEHFICPDCGTRQETRSRVLAAFRWNAFEELEAVSSDRSVRLLLRRQQKTHGDG